MFYQILNREMELATGCTEPGAIALTGAYAGAELAKLGDTIQRIEVSASTNIIKNAMAAGIPGTMYTGIPYAAAIGAVRAEPDRKLEVINGVAQDLYSQAQALVQAGRVQVKHAQSASKLYIDITCQGKEHTARAVIAQNHTKLVLLTVDDQQLFGMEESTSAAREQQEEDSIQQAEQQLNMRAIYNFCTQQLDPQHASMQIVRDAVRINGAISAEGLRMDYGLHIGRGLAADCEKGLIHMDMVIHSMIAAAAAADARMAGAPFSVVTNTGSGNQGITATVPVLALAQWLEVPEETMLRAVALSNLVTIRIKSKFGRLSALCGATVAGTGAACGITYLLGGGFDEICRAVHNMMGNVAGMLCDGAKPDCALKISSCVNAAFQAAFMALRGVRVSRNDGIVDEDVEQTIENFALLGNEGSGSMDEVMFRMMLNKPC